MQEVTIEGSQPYTPQGSSAALGNAKKPTMPQYIFRKTAFEGGLDTEDEQSVSSLAATPSGTIIHRVGPSSPMPSPSARNMLLIACLAAIVQASPITNPIQPSPAAIAHKPTPLENAGTVLSWTSTLLYLGSRLPQLFKNWRRKSTAGLSPLLFAAAFCGNLFYSSALLTNPCAWNDFGPYGGGGWAGSEGSDRTHWITAALPFFLGAAGVLGLDASVGVQFVLYGDPDSKVIVVEESKGRRWKWVKVNGWMRGWIPRSENKGAERDALLERSDLHGEGYGAI